MEPFTLKNESIFFLKQWMEKYPGLSAGFTTKNGGFSNGVYGSLNTGFHVGDNSESVQKSRRLLADSIGFPIESWTGAEQTHGTNIIKASELHRGRGGDSYDSAVKDTDGFYTDEQGILMTLCFADCVPLFFVAPKSKRVGIAHAGWKGTVNGIGHKMVKSWVKEGIPAEGIFAAIGPSICEKCYIVDERVITFVQNTLEHVEKKPYNLISEGQYSLDLKETNRLILLEAGIPDQNITVTGYCSSCDSEHFFSHRRDQGRTGRMLSFIGWKEGQQINESSSKA